MLGLLYVYSKAILHVPSAYCSLVFGQSDCEVSLGLSLVHFGAKLEKVYSTWVLAKENAGSPPDPQPVTEHKF